MEILSLAYYMSCKKVSILSQDKMHGKMVARFDKMFYNFPFGPELT